MASTRSEHGAPPATASIPLSVPEIRGNEWEYVKECLDTNWVSSVGPFVDRFEQVVADYLGARFAVATVNGTAALHLAMLVAGVEPGDEVLMPTLTFIAAANAVRYARAEPVLIDVESDYWQMDPQLLIRFVERQCSWKDGRLVNNATGQRVSAILPVHLLGHPVDMDPVIEVARKYNLVVIEDATESLGAQYKGRMTGRLGDIACLSFNGNKTITTGGGGMIVTDNSEWAARARHLSTQAKDHPVEYIHLEVGYNYRLSNLLAAVGCAQMEQVDDYLVAKRRIAATYGDVLGGVPGITTMREAPWAYSGFWMYTVLVDENEYGMGSRALLARLADAGVQSRPLWQPMHLSAVYRGCQAQLTGVADRLFRDGLSLPCSVGLTGPDQQRVVDAVRDLAA